MRKLLAVLLLSAVSWATTTVTGTIKNLGTGNLTNGAFVRFWLRGCAGNQPRITGTAIVGPSQGGVYYFDLSANGSGVVAGTIYSTRDSAGTGNGDIECGGVYTSVWYGMQVFVAGKGGPETPVHAKSGATLDISTVTPLTTNPVVTAPTGDSTYARIDGGNQPFSGSVSPSGNGTLNMGFANNRWLFFGSSLDISGPSTLTGAVGIGALLTAQLGAVVNVSGTGCGDALELTNIDTTPTNPNKFFRVNSTTGALELVNSACSTVIFSLDDSGNLTANGSITSGASGVFTAPSGAHTLLGGGAGTTYTSVNSGGTSCGGGCTNGTDVILQPAFATGSGTLHGTVEIGGVVSKVYTRTTAADTAAANNSPNPGIAVDYFKDDQTALIATRGPITVLTGAANTAGHYRLCYSEEVTTLDASGKTITFSAAWTSHAISRAFTGSAIAVAATNFEKNCVPMNVDASSNVTYTVTSSGAFATAQYAVAVWLVQE